MATNYPGSIDSLPRPTSTTAMDATGYEGDVVIDNISDAVEAIETELGADPAGGAATVRARLDTFGQTQVKAWTSGNYLNNQKSGISTAGTLTLSADRIYYVPFWVPASVTADRVAFRVSTGQASANIKVGLYADSSGVPSGSPVDLGEVDASAAALIEVTISQSLTGDGYVWVGILNETASVAVNSTSAVWPISSSDLGTASMAAWTYAFHTATYTSGLPSVGTLTMAYGTGCPLVAFRRT